MNTLNQLYLFIRYLFNYFYNLFLRNKKQIYIYHHLGLGDHIILNCLVRELVKNHSHSIFYLFCKFQNQSSVKFMLRDLNNLIVIPVSNDLFIKNYFKFIRNNDKIVLGFKNISYQFDIDFYKLNGFDFKIRFCTNPFPRDLESEKKLFSKLNLEAKEYIFVHDDSSRNLIIDEKYFLNRTVIRPFKTNNIFEWCYIIENAEEVHCICSSFKALVDSIQVTKPKLFYHLNFINNGRARNSTYTTSNLNWEVI